MPNGGCYLFIPITSNDEKVAILLPLFNHAFKIMHILFEGTYIDCMLEEILAMLIIPKGALSHFLWDGSK